MRIYTDTEGGAVQALYAKLVRDGHIRVADFDGYGNPSPWLTRRAQEALTDHIKKLPTFVRQRVADLVDNAVLLDIYEHSKAFEEAYLANSPRAVLEFWGVCINKMDDAILDDELDWLVPLDVRDDILRDNDPDYDTALADFMRMTA
jgi:hypothetical protein